MAKDIIYIGNTVATNVAADSQIPANETIRRSGCAMAAMNGGISLRKAGYYRVSGTVTFTSAAGNASITVAQDGQDVAGALVGLTAEASTAYTLPIEAVVRVRCPCAAPSVITLENGGTAISASNVALVAEYVG